MTSEPYSCYILADFNAANLAGYLNNDETDNSLRIIAETAPFGQVRQQLFDPTAAWKQQCYNAVVLWTRPETCLDSFRRAISYESVPLEELLDEVDEYAELIRSAATMADCLLIPAWTLPNYHRGYGMGNWKPGVGLADLLARLNIRLAEQLKDQSRIFLQDAGRWVACAGGGGFNPKLWYMGKIPFGNEVFRLAAEEIRAALAGFKGGARKLIVLDLDDTLWGGIVGDAGWENLRLGGHDPLGEAYSQFQLELKALTRRGIVLGIVSKNEESVALEAIRRHPEMILKENDFIAWKINWEDKARNLAELAEEVNLGFQSMVFIDDNPVERARVREQLPEVLVPEWPQDPLLYTKALLSLSCFDSPYTGEEDRQRTAMYVAERQRKGMWSQVSSMEDWLKSLEMRLNIEPLTESNLPRAAQLLNKTNQMNLCTRRLSEVELLNWANKENHFLWLLRVADRFGDSGLTGIVSARRDGDEFKIVDFVLSCRVFGRQIENLMLFLVVQGARKVGCTAVVAEYLATAKNKPTLEFFKKSGMKQISNNVFQWNIAETLKAPDHFQITNLFSAE